MTYIILELAEQILHDGVDELCVRLPQRSGFLVLGIRLGRRRSWVVDSSHADGRICSCCIVAVSQMRRVSGPVIVPSADGRIACLLVGLAEGYCIGVVGRMRLSVELGDWVLGVGGGASEE